MFGGYLFPPVFEGLMGVDGNGAPTDDSLHKLVERLKDAVHESGLLGKLFTTQYCRDSTFMFYIPTKTFTEGAPACQNTTETT
jgi:hypothetical protein